MGFWKSVAYDMQRGMSKERAIEVNAALRDRSITEEERKKIVSKGEAEIKINSMR